MSQSFDSIFTEYQRLMSQISRLVRENAIYCARLERVKSSPHRAEEAQEIYNQLVDIHNRMNDLIQRAAPLLKLLS